MPRLVNEFATNATQSVGDQTGQPPRVSASAGFLGNGFAPGYTMPGRMFNDEFASHAAAIRQTQAALLGSFGSFFNFGDFSGTVPLMPVADGLAVRDIITDDSKYHTGQDVSPALYTDTDVISAATVLSANGPEGLVTDGTTIKAVVYRSGAAISTSVACDRLAVCAPAGTTPRWFALQSDGDLYQANQTGLITALSFNAVSGGVIKITSAETMCADGPCIALLKANGGEVEFTISTDMGVSFIDTVTTSEGMSVGAGEVQAAIDSVNGKLFFGAPGESFYSVDLDGTGLTEIPLRADGATMSAGYPTVACVGHGIVGLLEKGTLGMNFRVSSDGGANWLATNPSPYRSTAVNMGLWAGAGAFWITHEFATAFALRSHGVLPGYSI